MGNDLQAEARGGHVDITAITHLKHAILWAACKKCGSQSALAKAIGVAPQTVGDWLSFKSCPPAYPIIHHHPYWTNQKIEAIQERLFQITGEYWNEIFPEALRKNIEAISCRATHERTQRIEAECLEQYAFNTTARLKRIATDGPTGRDIERKEVSTAVESALATLSERECIVIKKRFGIDGETPAPLEVVAKAVGVTRERVRQIEAKAIYKLRESRLRLDRLI